MRQGLRPGVQNEFAGKERPVRQSEVGTPSLRSYSQRPASLNLALSTTDPCMPPNIFLPCQSRSVHYTAMLPSLSLLSTYLIAFDMR